MECQINEWHLARLYRPPQAYLFLRLKPIQFPEIRLHPKLERSEGIKKALHSSLPFFNPLMMVC